MRLFVFILFWMASYGFLTGTSQSLGTEVQKQPGLMAGSAALTITPADENGQPWQEPYQDLNANGRYDAPDPSHPNEPYDAFTDTNGNGKWDGPFLAGFHHHGNYYTASGVHDPVWARALVLQKGEVRVGLVVLDVVGLFYPRVEEIRKRVDDLGFTHVMVASTHTHGGTDSMGLWGPNRLTDGKDPRFMEHILKRAELALREAVKRLTPARLKFANANTPTQFGWLINDLRDPIVIDDQILMMAVDDLQGNAIATVVNWTPHPETMGGASSLITSDFPHYLREGVEKGEFRSNGRRWKGRGGIAIYLSGSVGGLLSTLRLEVRDEDGKALPPRSWAMTQRIGEIVAGVVLDALRDREYMEIDRIGVRIKKLFIPIENQLFKQLLVQGVIHREAYSQGKPVGSRGEDALTEVNVLTLLGQDVAVAQFVTVPGELFPEIAIGGYLDDEEKCWRYTQRKRRLDGRGRERVAAAHPQVSTEPVLRHHMKARYQFIIGLGNDELGYIVPANDFVPPVYKPRLRYGTDRCGDHDHYEETMSVGSQAAPLISKGIVELLEQVDVP
jgi:hypothetical protein